MADPKELNRGLIINIGTEVWFLPLGEKETPENKIAEIKEVLVGGNGKSGAFSDARQLNDKEQHAISSLETKEIIDLLSGGITIRPMGR